MRCSYCGFDDSKVLDSRPVEEGRCIRRRRECLACGRRFTTYERIEELPLVVVKKDGRREQFDSGKILSGLIKACDKRSVPVSVLETLVADLEKDLRQECDREIPAAAIGEGVMKRLRAIDEVAYVRFASVYRKFEDIYTFMDELRTLQKNK
ncbi:MAG: transcriptional regulator NrdR [Clostridia bacterium]|nr:transcriptional regulator NrdR [Clostridia bacterium]